MPFQSKTYSCGSLGKVRRLDNLNHGQANWVNVPVTQAATNGIQLLDIQTAPNNGDHVFTVGPSVGLSASPQFFGVAVSNDGGTTWNIPGGNYQAAAGLSIDNGLLFQWNEVMVVGPQVYGVSGFSVIVGTINSIDYHGTIAVSNDGGATYNTLPWYNNLLSAPNPPMADMDCTSVHFPNLNVGVVALNLPGSLTSYVIKTTDGGGTWLVMNGQNYLTTSLFPNPPGTILPIGPITGISILANQEHIIGVGADFVVSTEPVNTGSPTAGVAADSWRNNGLTNSGVGPPVNQGFYPGIPIGWHLGTFLSPDENVVWISGDSKLGVHSIDHGESTYTVTPGPGWDGSGTGFSRRASHFYFNNLIVDPNVGIIGFYNQSDVTGNKVYWNNRGFSPPFEVLSDDLPGLNYSPTAIWTWYEELPPLPCYKLENCLDSNQVLYTQSTCLNGQPINYVVQLDAPHAGICWKIVDPGDNPDCIGAVPVTCLGFNIDCAAAQCAPPPGPCECPQGTTQVTLPNGTIVCREDIAVLAEGPDPLSGCQKNAVGVNSPLAPALLFGPSPQYSRYGANFYGETSGVAWPINFTTGCTLSSQSWNSFPSVPLPIVNSVSNSAWGTGGPGLDGRVNAGAGITMGSTPCAGPIAGGSRYGTVFCLNVASTNTYSFGFMGFAPEILINGLSFVQAAPGAGDIYQYETWTVIQLTLPAGDYIIQMSAVPGTGVDTCGNFTFNNPPLSPRNPGSIVGWAFEIYDATIAALAAMTNQGQVDATLVYSTKNEDGLPIDYGEAVFNYRCPCGPPPEICPDAFGNYNVIKPILDNCTVNSLNPNANPRIYVCHTYKYTALEGCCYLLTNCTNPSNSFLTSSDLGIHVGNVVTLLDNQGLPIIGCWIVSLAPDCGPVLNPTVTVVQDYGSSLAPINGCDLCAPKCYLLTDCEGNIPPFVVSDDMSAYVTPDLVIRFCPESPSQNPPITECTCFTVTESPNCDNSLILPAGTIISSSLTCEECLPVCYSLTNCQDVSQVTITDTDLSSYIGQVIYIDGCPGTCWIVALAADCTGKVPVVPLEFFADCNTCLGIKPLPPVPLKTRAVQPGYYTEGCPPEYTEKVNCRFSEAMYKDMLVKRYGITPCCNEDMDKWRIKKQILDLKVLYDSTLCLSLSEICCPPCNVTAIVEVFTPINCAPPTNVTGTFEFTPVTCDAPSNVSGVIIIDPVINNCVCYQITINNPAIPCLFDFIDCNGQQQTDYLVAGYAAICAQTYPQSSSCTPFVDYTITASAANCNNGGCV